MVTLYGDPSVAPVPTAFCSFTVARAEGWWWPPTSCKVEPVDATSSDETTITLGGDWPNSCVPNVAQITTDGNTVNFDVVLDYPAGADCPAVITPWSLSATLGPPLTPDTYSVTATLYGDPTVEPAPNSVCSFTVKPANPIAQNRYIAMEVSATESEQTAIEVTLAMLHHTCSPGSWNVLDPCLSDAYCRGGVCQTPFAEFEGQKRYVNAIQMCRGGTEDGRGMCESQDDCDDRGLGGTCEQMHTCQGGTEPGGNACIDQAACDVRMHPVTMIPRGGTCLPSITCEDSETRDTTFACAVLGCQPEYRDWVTELGGRTLFATGPEIMPGASRYEITLVPASCMGNEASCAETLPLLTVGTPRWGDVEDHVGVSTLDLVHMVDRMMELGGTILKPAAQFQPQQVNPLNPMDVRDLALAVDAVKFFPYPYKTLTPCE
ncbi:MAG: hypothetical protein IID35_03320 [Planctomycetes bacterium]|nr:hypothetical protein [Planctomycetota bacterium]